MTTIAIKQEIHKVVDHLPVEALEKVLAWLKGWDKKDASISQQLETIFREDHELLKKLAQ